jgi:hypothetical protein
MIFTLFVVLFSGQGVLVPMQSIEACLRAEAELDRTLVEYSQCEVIFNDGEEV